MDKILVRRNHIGEDLLAYFTERDSYEENPYIKYDAYKDADYMSCVDLA